MERRETHNCRIYVELFFLINSVTGMYICYGFALEHRQRARIDINSRPAFSNLQQWQDKYSQIHLTDFGEWCDYCAY